jgi:hypothetical protein
LKAIGWKRWRRNGKEKRKVADQGRVEMKVCQTFDLHFACRENVARLNDPHLPNSKARLETVITKDKVIATWTVW